MITEVINDVSKLPKGYYIPSFFTKWLTKVARIKNKETEIRKANIYSSERGE